jgi:FKBP-type peptidyl-prolyl cis-trans isomerase
MATPVSQRIGIWIIAVVLIVGTLGSFLVMALSVQNSSADETRIAQLQADYNAAVSKQARDLSDSYYDVFKPYQDWPSEFETALVKQLETKDLVVGQGEEITADSAYHAYYIGWNPYGKVFDSSFDVSGLKAPLQGGSMIEGWNQGILGMKTGGIRELSIPSDLAYSSSGSGENILPDMPIKFVVLVIPPVEEVQIPDELWQYYLRNYQS